MQLLIGLGNPGAKYARHRHNIGFMAIDAIARRYGFPAFIAKHHGEIAKGNVSGQDALLFKPMTYMNRSGEPVGEAMRFYKIPLENVLVIHDDLDLAVGKVKVKQGGGSGGHNGLKSLDEQIGERYWRVRIGIGHPLRQGASEENPGNKDAVSDYVLSNFTAEEMALETPVIASIADHLLLLLEGDAAKFLNEIAKDTKVPKQKKEV